MSLPPKNHDIYSATIKMFGSQPEPAFETAERQIEVWGRTWGCDNDVGQIRAVLMHRPGDEFNIIDPTKRIEEIGAYGDVQSGWYWQSETIPELAEMQAQHDSLADTLRAEGADVIYLEGVDGGRFKSVYTRDSSFAVKGGAIVTRLAPRMRPCTQSKYLLAKLRKVSRLALRMSRNFFSASWSFLLARTDWASFLLGPTFSRMRLPWAR